MKTTKAFTLAEVLITLGIIGIVAAMTMPALITKHRRQVAETKLQKFYSVINNAMKMIEADYGEITEITTSNGSDTSNFSKEFYEKYFTPYMSNVKVSKFKKSNKNYVSFVDGSGFYVRNYYKELNFLYYIDINKYGTPDYEKYEFYFNYNPTRHVVTPYGIYWSDNTLYPASQFERQKRECYNLSYHYYCAAVLQRNGWKIPDDYPHIK